MQEDDVEVKGLMARKYDDFLCLRHTIPICLGALTKPCICLNSNGIYIHISYYSVTK